MNIPRVNSDGIVPPAKAKAPPPKALLSRTTADVFKPEHNQRLINRIHEEPDVRPEVVERARALIADPNYPSGEVLAQAAQALLEQNTP